MLNGFSFEKHISLDFANVDGLLVVEFGVLFWRVFDDTGAPYCSISSKSVLSHANLNS